MKRLFVGNTDLSLSEEAKRFSANAVLIDKHNISDIDNIDVGYISIGDHSVNDFVFALKSAEELHFVSSLVWEESTRSYTEFWLKYFSHRKIVHNFTPTPYLNTYREIFKLADDRKINGKQLWVAGDSFTVGTPWVNEQETYRYLLGKQLNLPVSVLAKGGSSISWAADQILRSDIKKGDIVVFMLTSTSRFPYYTDTVNHIYSHSWELDPTLGTVINQKIQTLPHLLYLAYRSIEQVIHDSAKVGYHLVLTKTPLDDVEYEFAMTDYLSNFRFFVHNYQDPADNLLDFGSDGQHPGPLQHQHYANTILEYLKNENLS